MVIVETKHEPGHLPERNRASDCGRTCEETYGEYGHCPHCGAEVEDGWAA